MDNLPEVMQGASGISGHWQYIAMITAVLFGGIISFIKWMIDRSDKKEAERTAERKQARDCELTAIRTDIAAVKTEVAEVKKQIKSIQSKLNKPKEGSK